ncbi:penicillin-binding Tp47 domain C-containing protein [Lachnospira eligens]|uniref:penicillin-binding Tp47 domain C-containing protein n=1 Tax=Lachnospira eligens TaxID=39485 RepID=UPI0018978E83|nr:penicillin-binding Tp47 domain C-containing protein [Lachnospira eligens]
MRKNIFTKIAAVAAATVLAVTALPALVSDTHAADDEYSYVYAGLTWQEYWANEGVYNAGDVTTSNEKDTHGEYDKGAFDTVTRATTNHGLHRGSYQCMATIDTEDGKKYELAGWTGDAKNQIMILTDGTQLSYSKGVITNTDGTTSKLSSYEVTGIKYVPVKVKTSDLADFEQHYRVVKNGEKLYGGFGENKLSSYEYTAAVNADTNGLKTAVKNADGTYSFSARQTGSGKSFAEQDISVAANITSTVKDATGSYGEFLRVDINGDGYGALGAMMQAVKWTYYGNDATRTNVVATYGTKFAADNWMHKSMGIQLGLTDSARCKLPAGYDGTGYWSLTVYALGYTDTTIDFEATDANIVKVKAPVSDTSKLSAAIAAADALSEADYTAESWAAMKLEYEEAVDALAVAEYQADVDEATEHLTAAINALVKVDAGTPSGSEESDNTTEAGTSDTSVSDVKTGDSNNMMAYIVAAALALTSGAAVTGRRKIKNVR